jgi:hypothetical protein
MNIDAKKMVNIAQVTHGELGVEGGDDGVKEGGGVGGEDDVINVQQQKGNGRTMAENEKRGITLGGRKTKSSDEGGEAMKPGARCLFKTIKRLVQAANMRGMSGVNKAGGLLTIDGLMKMPMEECVLDVELMNGPRVHGGKAEHNADGGGLDHGA